MHSKNYNNNTNQSINQSISIHVTMPVVTVTSLRNGSVVHSSQVVVNSQARDLCRLRYDERHTLQAVNFLHQTIEIIESQCCLTTDGEPTKLCINPALDFDKSTADSR